MNRSIETTADRREEEFGCLRMVSARLGADPLLVQGSNGNTSLKSEGKLWIKASGRRLSDSLCDETFVGVDLAAARACVKAHRAISAYWPAKGLRPSVETAMHAVIPHRVVFHVHSIHTIAWAVRCEGLSGMEERLEGLRWRWIPYVASGIPLAHEIAAAIATAPDTNIFILGNHGLVACSDDPGSTEELVREVDKRLALPVRIWPAPCPTALQHAAKRPNWRHPELNDVVHALGTDPLTVKIVRGGILYPCQALYLRARMPVRCGEMVEVSRSQMPVGNDNAAFAVLEGSGVVFREDLTEEAALTLRALAEVTQRIEEGTPVRFLSPTQVAEVLNGDPHRMGHTGQPSARLLRARVKTAGA